MRVFSWQRFSMTSRAAAAAVAAALWATSAHAQFGSANVPLPNVLLLQDTSGSFEYMVDGNTPETAAEGGTCAFNMPANPNGYPGTVQSNPNRWGVAIQALTGNILPYYSCAAMDRSQQGFLNQYSIAAGPGAAQPPYDYDYYLPFHRPLSYNPTSGVSCAYTPWNLPGAPGGGVGTNGGGFGLPPAATGPADCNGAPCNALGFPADAIGQFAFLSQGAPLPNTGVCAPQACANAVSETVNSLANACSFSQAPNGALDSASTLMRFGLMTFDNDPQPETGATVSVASPFDANTPNSVFNGQWSYFNGWDTGTGGNVPGTLGLQGWPAGCSLTPQYFEVGARNPAAPPWEGRLVMFPNQSADTTATVANNQLVQLALESMRPYGATPMAGMLADAEYYMWGDAAGPGQSDKFVQGGCRPEYIIILTDGLPNEDLGVTEPVAGSSCMGAGPPAGKCPYQTPAATAAALFNGNDPVTHLSGQSVTTYVIGFAVSENITVSLPPAPPVTLANCQSLSNSATFAADCATATYSSPQYPCCVLEQIAVAGQGGAPGARAYFADTPGDLSAALAAVLGQIAKQLSSRTLPVYSPTVNYTPGQGGSTSMFLTTFNGAVSPWQGDLQREPIVCVAGTPTYENVTPTEGDDFGVNLEPATSPSTGRKFLTYQLPSPGQGASATIRPFDTAPTDGFIAFGQTGAEIGLTPGNVLGMNNLANMLGATNSSCENPVTQTFTIPAAGCAKVGLSFLMAQPSVTSGDTAVPSFDISYATQVAPRVSYPLGPVLHSNPSYSVPPGGNLRDDSYQAYAQTIVSLGTPGTPPTPVSGGTPAIGNPRDPMIYVATTDGLLHAFDTTLGAVKNELWSFIPPGTFPNLIADYPGGENIILDGAPVVKDVVWERDQGGTTAQWQTAWHTMLVAGFGAGGRGYYALDVTDPRTTSYTATSNYSSLPPSCASNTSFCTGPHFQWQIASMNLPGGPANQAELFGTTGATPAITTVYADPTGAGANPKEIGVAILPGGSNGPPSAGPPALCPRDFFAHAGSYTPAANFDDHDTNFPLRPNVRAWASQCTGAGSGVPGRSVTIVRLDTGDIIAVFARPLTSSPDVPSELAASKLIPAPFDSPMTGTPVVYPSSVGAIAEQVFIGDADGTLWRLNITDPNPANWRAAFFSDAYSANADTGGPNSPPLPNNTVYDAEAIAVTPLVTIDRQGNVTVQYATGDQNSYTANYTIPGAPTQTYQGVNFVYSLKLTTAAGGAQVAQTNWFLPLLQGGPVPSEGAGERVTGPMVVYNNTFYFATFVPPNPLGGNPVCTGGNPKLWGMDYESAAACGGLSPIGCGGMPRDFLPSGYLLNPPDANGNPTVNIVIPGVAVAVTPSCATTTAPVFDQYTGGVQSGTSGTSSGTFSLMAQISGKNLTTGGQNTVSRQLIAPNNPTLVDSWAQLSE
jgi:type IV pilus assembly protein PilY1